VCLISKLPISMSFKGDLLHSDNRPAVVYNNGFHIYYKDDNAYPAQWSLHPDEVDATEIVNLSNRKRLSLLFSFLGDNRTASLLGQKGLWR